MHVNFSPLTWTRETEPNPQRAPFKTKNARDSRNYLYITGMYTSDSDWLELFVFTYNIAHRNRAQHLRT